MRFRPCIDIHNGKVKQIVGGSLQDTGNQAAVNFASEQEADYYARLYKEDGLIGGHVILLNPPTSSYYMETKKQACKALGAYPGGLQIGGKCGRVFEYGSQPCDCDVLRVSGRTDPLGTDGKIEKHSGERESCHRCKLPQERR